MGWAVGGRCSAAGTAPPGAMTSGVLRRPGGVTGVPHNGGCERVGRAGGVVGRVGDRGCRRRLRGRCEAAVAAPPGVAIPEVLRLPVDVTGVPHGGGCERVEAAIGAVERGGDRDCRERLRERVVVAVAAPPGAVVPGVLGPPGGVTGVPHGGGCERGGGWLRAGRAGRRPRLSQTS